MNYGQNHSSDAAAQQQKQTALEAADINQNKNSAFASVHDRRAIAGQ